MKEHQGYSQMGIIQASEILSKIEREEPLIYEKAIIVGDLDLGNLDLPKIDVERSNEEIKFLKMGDIVLTPSCFIVAR
jgi:hypothetical protein